MVLECDKTYIAQIERGTRKLSSKLFDKISVLFPELVAYYPNEIDEIDVNEFNIKGQKIKSKITEFGQNSISTISTIISSPKSILVDDCITINEILDIYPTCKSGIFVAPQTMIKVNIPYSCISNYSSENTYIKFTAMGNDMCPYIQSGDKLIFKAFDDEVDYIENNCIYAIRYGKGFFIRRLVKNINRISIITDNNSPEYETIVLEDNTSESKNLTVIGKIVGLHRNI